MQPDCPLIVHGVHQTINLDHVMASVAVPLIFPPVRINGQFFGDGAMRQAMPLSPAIHLGADRILVIGIRDETADPPQAPFEIHKPPSIAEIAGYMLDTLFMDGLYSDLERMTRINQLIDAVPANQRSGAISRMRPIDTMVVLPSKDLREIAHKHRRAMPVTIRALLRGIGDKRNTADGERSRLLSFLLFEQKFTQELIELGFMDAMRVKDELLRFLTGEEVPRLIARYVVLRQLGAGGMGVVYSAYDETLDRRVAIKLLRHGRSRSDEARARLLRAIFV